MTTLEASSADTACGRCGTFAPQAPFWGRLLCADCVSREPALFSAPPTAASLLDAARVLFGRVGLKILLLNAVAAMPGALAELKGIEWSGMRFPEFMLEIAVGGVCTHLALQAAANDKSVSFKQACGAVGRKFGLLIGTSFLGGLTALFFALLLVVPGFLRLLSYTLSTPIALLERPDGSYDALKRSTERMAGHRWAAFGAYMAVLGVTFLLPFAAYMTALFASMNDAGESPIESLLSAGFLFTVSTLVGLHHLIPAALYVKLTPPSVWPLREN
jgi:hypothetical protein